MAVAKEIRTKIRSIKNTQKITRAMEMVAASKMRSICLRVGRWSVILPVLRRLFMVSNTLMCF